MMRLEDKIMFGNYPWMIIFYPLILFFRFIKWLKDPHKFCKHEWEVKKLEVTYGVFGGMEVYRCKKCGKEDWNRNAEKRLKRAGLLR